MKRDLTPFNEFWFRVVAKTEYGTTRSQWASVFTQQDRQYMPLTRQRLHLRRHCDRATFVPRGGSRMWSWGPNQGVWGWKSPSGVQGRSPGRSLGTESPRSWSILKIHNLNFLGPCENERRNLMLLMSFFIAVHTGPGGRSPTEAGAFLKYTA